MPLRNVNSSQSDFVGAIRNVVIGQSQVDLRCPQEEVNTLIGKDKKLQTKVYHGSMEL